jgi:hypothetical protein
MKRTPKYVGIDVHRVRSRGTYLLTRERATAGSRWDRARPCTTSADDEAIRLINDSRYGLTSSVWTTDPEAALYIGDRIETGTWFMNRCDYLDPPHWRGRA